MVFLGTEAAAYQTSSPSVLSTALAINRGGAPPLNPVSFTPYTITAKETLSPTAFVLTVRPADGARDGAPLWAAHRGATWSLEVKQPQLQIARDYTPLPPAGPAGELRFLVRSVRGGEVSTYLARLAPGDVVELRGPRAGFDVGRRLGGGGGVVFLAGGTGVAPALQVAEAVLGGGRPGDGGPAVTVLWANRGRADCRGCGPGWFRTPACGA